MTTGEQNTHFDGESEAGFNEMRKYFRENFNTDLAPEDEFRFHDWLDEQSKFLKRDLMDEMDHYDLRGAYTELCDCDDDMLSWPSKFKKPNHPTFAIDSIYNGAINQLTGGTFCGGEWGHMEDDGEKIITFKPSGEMLKSTHPEKWLKGYFSRNCEDVELLLDDNRE